MAVKVKPERWAVSLFGRETTELLIEAIPEILQAAVARQMDAQLGGGQSKRFVWGGGWSIRFDQFVEDLAEKDGAQLVRPEGAPYKLIAFNNVLLVPVEYANDTKTSRHSPTAMKKIDKWSLGLARRFGPKPEHVQPTLDGLEIGGDGDQGELVGGLLPAGIVIVYYAAHERLGLLDVGWGQVGVNAMGLTEWFHDQQLPVPATPLFLKSGMTVVRTATQETPRFDQAAMTTPSLRPRTKQQQVTVRPVSELPTESQQSDVQD